MRYIIDGYNLLFRTLKNDETLAKNRQFIIEDLNRKIQTIGIDVVIVFDANYRLDESTKSHYKHLEIQFTSHAVTADEWIVHLVKNSKNPEHLIVVTSDKPLSMYVRQHLGKTETVDAFLALLNKRYKNKGNGKKRNIEAENEIQNPKEVKNQESKISLARPLIPLKEKEVKRVVKRKTEELTDEAHFEYYLKEFEANFNKIAKLKKPVKKPKELKKHEFPKERKLKEKRAKTEDEMGLSDMERWLKAFDG